MKTENTPGMVIDMPNKDYHKHSSLSKSGIDRMLISPAHYVAYREQEHKETQAMMIGTALHTAILEPDIFEKEYICGIGDDKRLKAWKAFAERHEDKILLKESEFKAIKEITAALRSHLIAKQLIKGGVKETSHFAELDDVNVKCRPDYLFPNNGVCVDLKSTISAAPDEFARSCAKYNYHVQHAFYLDVLNAAGIEADTFIFIAFEKELPYAVGIYELDQQAIKAGRDTYKFAMSRYRACMRTGHWPAYSDDIVELSLPPWAL
jgi:exodeoxyribonuclease VIII